MKTPRFYQACSLTVGEKLALSIENHRHAIQVLRLKVDDKLVLFNGDGGECLATLLQADKRKSSVIIESYESVSVDSCLETKVFLAMIKPDKMDFAIQKLVELGVSTIQPMYTKRSVIKLKSNRLEKKLQHWKGIIVAACEQSGRTSIPKIESPKVIDECLAGDPDFSGFVLLPGAISKIGEQGKLKAKKVSLYIGPEGGFTEPEEQLMISKGVTPVSFGKRILRAETAAIAAITACQLEWGDLGAA